MKPPGSAENADGSAPPDPVVDVASGLSLRVAPNPAVARVRITVESGSRSGHVDGALGGAEQGGGAVNSVQADIVDVAGRRVRTLVVDAPATSGGLEWDLRDDGGRRVPSGLYWVRVVSGGSVAKRAVSVVR